MYWEHLDVHNIKQNISAKIDKLNDEKHFIRNVISFVLYKGNI